MSGDARLKACRARGSVWAHALLCAGPRPPGLNELAILRRASACTLILIAPSLPITRPRCLSHATLAKMLSRYTLCEQRRPS